MDPRIIKFIRQHHVLTLATSKDNIPWTSHCFYAFMKDEKALVFTTDNDTRHGQEMQDNQVVSGGIVLETKVVGMIRGVQLTGTVSKTQDSRFKTQDNTQHATRNTQYAVPGAPTSSTTPPPMRRSRCGRTRNAASL